MSAFTSLVNHFLIAMPALRDPNFFHTVTYICAHNDDGAMGLIINRPLDIKLGEVFTHMDIETPHTEVAQTPVLMGGPVNPERGFVLHTPPDAWDSTLRISDRIAVTTSRDILGKMAERAGPAQSLVALGYAGWGAGQLEQELADNAWLSVPATSHLIFDTPYEKRWEAAAALTGVDLRRLSSNVGHA